MAGTIYDIYKESNAASNAELERNFPTPTPGATPVRDMVNARRAAFEQAPAVPAPSLVGRLKGLYNKYIGPNAVTGSGAPSYTAEGADVANPNALDVAWSPSAGGAGSPGFYSPGATPDTTPAAVVAATPAAADPLADIKAKDAAIMNAPPTASRTGRGSYILDGTKRLDASGAAKGGFAMSEPHRLKEVAAVSARGAFARDKAAQDKLNELQAQRASLASEKIAGKEVYDRTFVGEAKMSNPSFRAAMANASAADATRKDTLAAMDSQIAGLSKQTVVGGQAYNDAADINSANVTKALSDANLAQATAASGGKSKAGSGERESAAIKEIVDIAAQDPAKVAVATAQRANIRAGGTLATARVPGKKGDELYTGVLSPEQAAAVARDEADVAAAQAKQKTSWFPGVRGITADTEQKTTAFRQRLAKMGMSLPALTTTK